jgi:protein-disulfide isomerase
MISIRRLAFATLAAPLALGLAACSDNGSSTTGTDPVAEVAPPEGTTWGQTVTRTEQGGWLMGNPDAPIKLVEYGSLTCPACAAFSAEGSAALKENYVESGRVSFELRSMILHGVVDLLLTRMLECGPNEVAIPLADQVWANLGDLQATYIPQGDAINNALQLPEDQRFVAVGQVGGFTDFFAARGISSDQAQACLADAAAVTQLAEVTNAAAQADAITGTPTFLINGQKIDALRWAEVEGALQRAGAR